MEQKKMRCHISIVIENAGKFLAALFAFAISQWDEIVENAFRKNAVEGKFYFIGVGIFILLFLLILLFYLNRWYKTLIFIEKGILTVERNTVNKKKNSYAIKNISNIDMEQNLFERLVGTYKIKIDTNSSALAENTDIKIIFSRQKAMEFKREITALMEQDNRADMLEDEEQNFDVAYSIKEILLNCFYTANILSLVFLVGLNIVFFFLVMQGDYNIIWEFIRDVGAVLVAGVSVLYSLIRGFFKFYGFKVKRNENKIHLRYGLLRKNMHTIPVDKISGIKLVQPFFSRIFGRYQVEIINIGMGDEENESAMLLLSCSLQEVRTYMSVLLPEFEEFIDIPVKKQPRKCLLHAGYYLLLEFAGITAVVLAGNHFFLHLSMWIGNLTIAMVILFFGLLHLCSYLTKGYYIGEEYLTVVEGIFTRSSVLIPYKKIQHIQINEDLMSKITGLKKATVFILASLLNSSMTLPLTEEDILEKIAGKIIKL